MHGVGSANLCHVLVAIICGFALVFEMQTTNGS